MPESVDEFVSHWRNLRARTVRVLEVIPKADLEWSPSATAFSFGDVFRHLAAIERFLYAEAVQGKPNAYPGHGRDLANGMDAVHAFLEQCHRESLEVFAALSEAQYRGRCLTPAGTSISVWKWLRAMGEHEAHHRGQLYLMASLRGHRVPPIFGLTEEDVVASSRPH